MTKKIFKTIFTLTIFVFFFCVVVLTAVVYIQTGNRKSDEIRSGLQWIQSAMETGNRDFLKSVSENQGMRVTWIDAEGNVLYDSAVSATDMESHLDRAEVKKALESGYGESIRYSETIQKRVFYCAACLKDGTVIRVSGVQYSIWSIIISMFTQIVVLLFIALMLSVLASAHVAKVVLAPINKLSLSNADDRDVYPELRPLVQRINQQNRQIHMQMDALHREHEKQDRMRQEFTANVSHELKTPLTSISGSAEIMMEGLVRPEDVPRFAGNIYNEAQRMIALVNDILRLSRLDDHQGELPREEVDLHALCSEQIARLLTLASRKNICFVQKGTTALVFGVPHMLEEIIYNLCDNAVKYNRDHGTVTLETVSCEEGVRLTVSDTGIGVPKDELQQIFERFYRVDKSHSREMGGTGLGLSIVKHAAQLHQARIYIDSQPHRGTTVQIIFPPYKKLEETPKI